MQFLNYFKMVLRAPRPKATPIALWIAGYFVFFFGIYAGKEIIASFAFLASMVMCYYFNSTPNMEAVFPVNHRKKLAYRFLSSLLMYLCMLAVVFVVGVVVFLITAVFVSISEGGFDWINKTPVEGDIFGGFNVYGLLFGFAYLIIMYSAGMITGFFKKRKTRNVWLACLCIAVVLAFVLMSLPYCVENGVFALVSPVSRECYEAMSLPWLSTVIWLLIAFGALGTVIYMGIRHYDPKKF